MGFKLGMEAALNYKAGGQGGGGAWTELTNVLDVTLNLEASEADLSTRGNNGWRATVATLKSATVEFEMVWDTADPGFTTIKDAYLANAIIGFQILDATAGQGLQADFMISSFSRSEPLEDGIKVSVSATIAHSTTPPTWIGGA